MRDHTVYLFSHFLKALKLSRNLEVFTKICPFLIAKSWSPMRQFHYYASITAITWNFSFSFIFKEFNSKHEKDNFEVGHVMVWRSHLTRVPSNYFHLFLEAWTAHQSSLKKCFKLMLLQGGSQFWLHVGNCFFDLLFVAFIILIILNSLPQRTLTLCLTIN